MSLTVSLALLQSTTTDHFQHLREIASSFERDYDLNVAKMDSDSLQDLLDAANRVNDAKVARAIESILHARSGNFDKPVPNFKAFLGVLSAFMSANVIDGWVYVAGKDGKLYPELVTSITFDCDSGRPVSSRRPSVQLHTVCYGLTYNDRHDSIMGVRRRTHVFHPTSVVNRRVSDILAAEGIFKETAALREAYFDSFERHRDVTRAGYSQQFRVTGKVLRFERGEHLRDSNDLTQRKVIHDLKPADQAPAQHHAESNFVDGGAGVIPEHAVIRAFDLRTHDFFWVHADNMEPHTYDKSLRDKLILPATHRDLLDVLTTDLGAFVNDFVEGKSAGNVILCKGVPGVGKTLTAEVYAELIERPLYSIHSGSLGTSADSIEKNLRVIFQRSQNWGCVLLLDEADVFVAQRGGSIEQNAIVAEFLRTLEYFDGLLFMTTNRPSGIDEAIVSRCAAIIDYAPPSAMDAASIWKVMAAQFKVALGDDLVAQLVSSFPEISPRDIKMLFRLALRVSEAHSQPLVLGTFLRCAMFRSIKIKIDESASVASNEVSHV